MLGAGISSDLAASQLYRYKTAAGETVLSRTIPPALVGNGYDVLNEKGRIVQTVPPALSAEQILARDEARARQKAQNEKLALQAQRDAELKQLYSHPDDAVRIMSRKGNDVLSLILARTGRIEFAQKNIVELEQKAAELQRKGVAVPKRYEDQMAALKTDIDNARAEIAEKSLDFDALLDEFSGIVKRLEVITQKESTQYEISLQKLIEIKQSVKIDN